MRNMLLRPSEAELDDFGEPDFLLLNAGEFPANRYTKDLTSSTSVSVDLTEKQMGACVCERGGAGKGWRQRLDDWPLARTHARQPSQ